MAELSTRYTPSEVEGEIARKWEAANAFHASPNDPAPGTPGKPYVIVIPPPNVTAALHLGHALNNTLQDVLIRWRRMAGDNAVWLPGTDHAGIATQTVVEKRVLAEEGKRRTDFKGEEGRREFVAKVQVWKDEYEATIIGQLKAMGCSCDWQRTRFTMDPVCARAVREAFFRLFKDGLIYRGKRLVNWDPETQTALADDEVEMQEIDGHFYYLKYPLADGSGHVTVATTRPETMLGDTAVAINPRDPRAAGLKGKIVRLPIVNRLIPIIEDDYVVLPVGMGGDENDAKAQFATGFLKVTPAHDDNDWLIGQRHNLPVINVLSPGAAISKDHGWPPEEWAADSGNDAEFLLGMDRFEAREAIVEWFRKENLFVEAKPYRHTVGHSYRSHVPIEPYLSDQWYVRVTDPRLAGAALRAMAGTGPEAGDGRRERAGREPWEGQLQFTPARYAETFRGWHENIRDWCISRQLWWGHRVPVWEILFTDYNRGGPTPEGAMKWHRTLFEQLQSHLDEYASASGCPGEFSVRGDPFTAQCHVCSRSERSDIAFRLVLKLNEETTLKKIPPSGQYPRVTLPDFPNDQAKHLAFDVSRLIYSAQQDPDVLDTWFSSALWPISTLGWPAPEDFPKEFPEGKATLEKWNPSNVLSTDRSIITLWVGRMVMFNLYFRGCLPFTDVFIHATILDGEGRKMSKSLGNGVDPLDIIHSHGSDAMRFTLIQMTTQTQDVRMPVERDAASGRNSSPKFDLGRNFANKLWNAVRFALGSLGGRLETGDRRPEDGGRDVRLTGNCAEVEELSLADRWILSALTRTLKATNAALEGFNFNVYAQTLYDFAWRDLCDWYLEAIKPVVAARDTAGRASRQTLAACLDTLLRMLHPVMPYITEKLWDELNAVCRDRSFSGVKLDPSDLCIKAPWPKLADALVDQRIEADFELLRSIVSAMREVRTTYKVPPRQKLAASIKASPEVAQRLLAQCSLIATLANVNCQEIGPAIAKPADAAASVAADVEIYLHGLIDAGQERNRLTKRLDEVSKSIANLEARLANKSYLDRAPAHLVQQTRDQLASVQKEQSTLRAQLTALGST